MDYFRSNRFLDSLSDWETGRPPTGSLDDYMPRMRALLRRLGDPQQRFFSVIVGGTNGKGTVAGLLAALLQASGRRVGLYTSPHLHSVRERIRLNGQVLSKDAWAAGVTQLSDRARGFEAEGRGAFSKFEGLTALAAHTFAAEGAHCGVFEVGLGGRYDATNAWDSQVAVLTAIGLDHVEALGDNVVAIAADKLHIARPGRPLFTTVGQVPEVLEHIRRHSEEHHLALSVAAVHNIEGPGPGAESPACAPVGRSGRPRTYAENAGLALAVAAHVAGDELDPEVAARIVRDHRWPGRFETARERPLVLLDGAHNPAAMVALVEDLRRISPAWRFVVGATAGHDATGVLRALEPVATEVVLTCSDHPKALDVESLSQCAPAGMGVVGQAENIRAFREAADSLGPDDQLCITGSLHLVARAREFFGLPGETEGVREDTTLESLECVEAACRNRGLGCARVSDNGHVLRVERRGRPLYFLRNKHPFNDYVAGRLAEDKGYQNEFFTRAGLRVPPTIQVFNPFAEARFDRYKTHASIGDMVAAAEERFTYPLLVKKYRSSGSQGVYLEHSRPTLEQRLQTLFENSPYGDNILLLQAYVPGPEYRIVATQEELLLAYQKCSEETIAQADLNPLHHATGRAVRVQDPDLLDAMRTLAAGVAAVIDLGFYAIDLIHGQGGLYILEINPNPFCYFFNKDNGRGEFVRIYERLIEKYVETGA